LRGGLGSRRCFLLFLWGNRDDALFREGGLELPGDRGLHRRRRALNELANFFQLLERALGIDAQFGGNLVYAWFSSHNSPVWANPVRARRYLHTRLILSRS
jgi:hypothetical protein